MQYIKALKRYTKGMSNVALVFNGHSRTLFDHIESHERNLIIPTECDVIISTWSNIDGGYSQTIRDKQSLALKESHVEKLKTVKNLVALEILPEDRHSEVKNIDNCFSRHAYVKAAPKFLSAGLYARKLSSTLLEKHELARGKKYDAVISMTMDACIHSQFDLSRVATQNTLFVPYPNHIKRNKLATSGRIAYGDRETMRFWLDMYDVFENHIRHQNVQLQYAPTMESIVANAILTNHINYDNINVSYSMHRLNGISIMYDHTRPAEFQTAPKAPCGCRR